MYLLHSFWRGMTEEQWRTSRAKALEHAGGKLPELAHIAGPSDDGFVMVQVFESKEIWDQFHENIVAEVGVIEGGLDRMPDEERGTEIIFAEGLAG